MTQLDEPGGTSTYWATSVRLNVVSEMSSRELLESEPLKAAIDGTEMTGRVIRGKAYKFRPEALQLLATNKLPYVSDHTEGFWRRMCVIGFPNFVPEHARIPDLAHWLIDHERLGIICWAIEGARRLVAQRGYTSLPSSVAITGAWRSESDQAIAFADDCVTADPTAWSTLGQVFNTYKTWGFEHGIRKLLTRRDLLARLERHDAGLVVVSPSGTKKGIRARLTDPA